MEKRYTNAFEKLFVSILNLTTTFVLSIPFLLYFGFTTKYRIALSILFLIQNILYIFISKNRYLGMIILNAYWEKEYSLKKKLLYSFLYSLSFATCVIWIYFPLDLLILNLLFIQLPFILVTGKTLHGYIAGMVGVRELD